MDNEVEVIEEKFFWCEADGGLYSNLIHKDNIPHVSIEISRELRDSLMGQEVIKDPSTGLPTIKAPTPPTEAQRVATLEAQAQAYQDSQMSKNEASAILGARASGSVLGEKAKANSDWLDSVWAIFYAKVADASDDREFSEAGIKLYTFAEVMAEADA